MPAHMLIVFVLGVGLVLGVFELMGILLHLH
jgi:hypothetical protein